MLITNQPIPQITVSPASSAIKIPFARECNTKLLNSTSVPSESITLRNALSRETPSIAIIGAGWYGCHLANVLIEQGYTVKIFERNSTVFSEASRWNQFRLHQGFHYARSWATRIETLKGFWQMRDKYPKLSAPVRSNFYAIAKESTLDFGTVLQIMDASGLDYKLVDTEDTKLSDVQGVLDCGEYTFLPTEAQSFFTEKLEGKCRFETSVSDVCESGGQIIVNGIMGGEAFSEEFDYAIDCTYNHLQAETIHEHYYEPCIMMTYKYTASDYIPPSYTGSIIRTHLISVIDGNFISLFEYQDGDSISFTLSSVSDTPMGIYTNSKDAEDRMNNISAKEIYEKRMIFEDQVCVFIKDFKETYEFTGHFTSCKTKLVSGSANRECVAQSSARLMSVFGGKITGIFHAEEYVNAWLQKSVMEACDARSIVLNHTAKKRTM